MASNTHKLLLHIFTLLFYECYLREGRLTVLKKKPFIWGDKKR